MTATAATTRGSRPRAALSLRYRLDVAGRSLAAIVGGFLLASAFAWIVAAVLIQTGAQPRGAAVGTGTRLSWLVWTGAAMWAFHAPGQARAWAWLILPAALLGGVAHLLGLEP